MYCNLLNLGGYWILHYYSVQVVFFLYMQQIEVRLVAIKSDYFSPYNPFQSSANTPFKDLQMLQKAKINFQVQGPMSNELHDTPAIKLHQTLTMIYPFCHISMNIDVHIT